MAMLTTIPGVWDTTLRRHSSVEAYTAAIFRTARQSVVSYSKEGAVRCVKGLASVYYSTLPT